MIFRIGAAFLVILAFFLFITRFHPIASVPLVPPSFALGNLTAASIASASTTLPSVTADGIYFSDTFDTPYFIYETTTKHAAIKELVFGNSNACQVEAGGYSCAAPLYGSPAEDARLVPGSVAHIEGGIEAQAIRVSTLSATSLPDGLQEVTIAAGDSATVGKLVISPSNPLTNASCTLGEGCTSAETIRVPVTIHDPSVHATELTTGAIYAIGNRLLILLSSTQQSGQWEYTFAIAAN